MKSTRVLILMLVLVMSLALALSSCSIGKKPGGSTGNNTDNSGDGGSSDGGDDVTPGGSEDGDGTTPGGSQDGKDDEDGGEDEDSQLAVDSDSTRGIVYEVASDGATAYVKEYKGTAAKVVISSKYGDYPVTEIGKSAFEGRKNLRSVTIPTSVKNISESAFKGCTSMAEIAPREGLVEIGTSAFAGCTALVGVTLPYTVEKIGADAFFGCYALKNVYVTDVDEWCNISFADAEANPLFFADKLFVGGNVADNIVIGNTVSAISEHVFSASHIKSITLPAGLRSVAKGALSQCQSLESLTVPYIGGSILANNYIGYLFGADSYKQNAIYVPDSLETVTVLGGGFVGEGAFYGCSKICEINLPTSVASIGAEAFGGCMCLTDFTVGDQITEIGLGAFEGCNAMGRITLPFVGGSQTENTYLGYIFGAEAPKDSAEYIPTALRTVNITSSRVIAENAFAGCTRLTQITLSRTVTEIGLGALADCKELVNLSVPFVGRGVGGNTHFGYIFGAVSHAENGESVPTSLRSVKVLSATSIGDNAFAGCSSLTSIDLTSAVTSIGAAAFSGCSSLQSFVVPFEVKTIGASAFDGCPVVYLYCMTWKKPSGWDSTWNPGERPVEWRYVLSGVTEDGFSWSKQYNTMSVTGYVGTEVDLVIPSEIDGYLVTSIGERAFQDNKSLRSVVLPGTVTQLMKYSFYGCEALESITLPEGLVSINLGALYGTALTSVTLPKSLEKLGESALSYCRNLHTVIIPDGSKLKEIGAPDSKSGSGGWAFKESVSLSNVYVDSIEHWLSITFRDIESNPLYIAKNFYVGGEKVNEVDVPESITAILPYAFASNIFTRISLHDGVVSIGANGFNGCTYLKSLYIPAGVSTVGDNAFYGCTRLNVYVAAAEPGAEWGANWNFNSRPVVFGCPERGLTEDGYDWVKVDAQNVTITGYFGQGLSLTIPSVINDTPVTAIAQGAFRDYADAVTATIPQSVVRIDKDAFKGCTSLVKVSFANPNGWKRFATTVASTGTELALADAGEAANLLTSKYSSYYWRFVAESEN